MSDFIGPLPSGNWMTGRNGLAIDKIVIHWMAGTFTSADARFRGPDRVSAHYGIKQDGSVFCWVRPDHTAFHAGDWQTNLTSIGIEHECGPNTPPSEAMYAASGKLVRDLRTLYGPLSLVPHRDVVATQCPGTFDLARIEEDTLPFKDDPDAQAYVINVRETIEAIKAVLAEQAAQIRAAGSEHKHQTPATETGGPVL